jgi:IS5 family transposase
MRRVSRQMSFADGLARQRAGVERVFATMNRCYGYRGVRYHSFCRNACNLHLMCAAMNLLLCRLVLIAWRTESPTREKQGEWS